MNHNRIVGKRRLAAHRFLRSVKYYIPKRNMPLIIDIAQLPKMNAGELAKWIRELGSTNAGNIINLPNDNNAKISFHHIDFIKKFGNEQMLEKLILDKPMFLCSAFEHDHMRCEEQCAICKANH